MDKSGSIEGFVGWCMIAEVGIKVFWYLVSIIVHLIQDCLVRNKFPLVVV